MKARSPIGLRYRLEVAARLIGAIVGGYGIAVLIAIAGAWALPMQRIDAVAIAAILALLAMPVVAMGCFWARSPARAWAGILLCALVLAVVAMAGGWRP